VPTDNSDVQPIRLADAVRTGLWIIIATSVVGLGLGIFASSQMKEQSVATTEILIQPLDGNPFYPSSRGEQLVNLETEAQVLRSTDVAEMVGERMDTDLTTDELLSGVKVGVPPNTQILEVSFNAGRDQVALDGSQAFAEAYLDYREQRARTQIDEQVASLEEDIQAIGVRIDELSDDLRAEDPESVDYQLTQAALDRASAELATADAQQTSIESTPVDPGNVVTPAALEPAGPVTPRTLLPLLGLLVGLAAGVGIALVRSRGDDRLRAPSDVEELGVPLLGTIAWNDPSAPSSKVAPDVINEDEYRKLRVAILATERRRPFTLLVGGASAASTGPLTVVDLCTSMARSGLDTVVVDATSHGEGPARILDPENEVGLADVLLGDAALTDALSPVAPLLWVLPPGQAIANVADLFVGGEMARMLDAAKDHCDVVIVAADSLQQGVAQSLADMSDAVLVEADQDRTTRPELERSARALNLLTSTFLGAVFMGRDAAERTQVFRPNFTVNQRQLPPGPRGVLPGSDEDRPVSADGPIEAGPAPQDRDAETGSDDEGTPDEDTARRNDRNGTSVTSNASSTNRGDARGRYGDATKGDDTRGQGGKSQGSKGQSAKGSNGRGDADTRGRGRREDPAKGGQ
jgi:capsular polysaccharide biosynthesis protein/Mrp family chromosome partitioning ATPase